MYLYGLLLGTFIEQHMYISLIQNESYQLTPEKTKNTDQRKK